eukprot:3246295-Rhodomonas_salina.1
MFDRVLHLDFGWQSKQASQSDDLSSQCVLELEWVCDSRGPPFMSLMRPVIVRPVYNYKSIFGKKVVENLRIAEGELDSDILRPLPGNFLRDVLAHASNLVAGVPGYGMAVNDNVHEISTLSDFGVPVQGRNSYAKIGKSTQAYPWNLSLQSYNLKHTILDLQCRHGRDLFISPPLMAAAAAMDFNVLLAVLAREFDRVLREIHCSACYNCWYCQQGQNVTVLVPGIMRVQRRSENSKPLGRIQPDPTS